MEMKNASTTMDFLYGDVESLFDTFEFIEMKGYEGWKVMCQPFRSSCGKRWNFLLYRHK